MTGESLTRSMDQKKSHGVFLFVAGALFTLSVLVLVEQNTHFKGHDFLHFYLAKRLPLLEYAFTPIDVHVLPLHRLSSYLLYTLFPFNYRFALLVLLCFHVGTIAYLWKTLQALKETQLNRLLVFLYAANVYLFVNFLWWSSGIARFPYIFFAVGSIYHYLRFRASASPRQLMLVAGFFILSVGFYTKGLLIPAYLLGLEICLLKETSRVQLLRNLCFLCGLALTSLVLYQMGRTGVSERYAELHFDVDFLLELVRRSLVVLCQGLLTFVHRPDRTVINVAISSIWVSLFLYTVIRRPYNLLVWCVGLGLVALNVLVIGISSRGVRLHLALVGVYRYYFELVFLVVIFIGLTLHNLPRELRSNAIARLEPRGGLSFLVGVGVLVYVLLSYFNGKALMERRHAPHRQTKVYMDNLLTSIENLCANPSEEVHFVDGKVPRYVLSFLWGRLGRHSTFLEILGVQASFDEHSAALYRITEEGRIERVQDNGTGAE